MPYTAIPMAAKGAPHGVAPLDGDAMVPAGHLPPPAVEVAGVWNHAEGDITAGADIDAPENIILWSDVGALDAVLIEYHLHLAGRTGSDDEGLIEPGLDGADGTLDAVGQGYSGAYVFEDENGMYVRHVIHPSHTIGDLAHSVYIFDTTAAEIVQFYTEVQSLDGTGLRPRLTVSHFGGTLHLVATVMASIIRGTV